MRYLIVNKFILFIILLSISNSSFGDNVLQLTIKGKQYEQLELKMTRNYANSTYLKGEKCSVDIWNFQIPDSIYDSSINMSIVVPTNNDTIMHQLVLSHAMAANDTIETMQFFTKKGVAELVLTYQKSERKENVPYLNKKDGIYDYFYVSANDFEFESSILKLQNLFGFFSKTSSYEENLKKYITLVKKYTDSHSLISGLYLTLNRYKSKNDVENIFSHFSIAQKSSYYGKLIQAYLYPEVFPNMQLKVLGEDRMEPIIINKEKENLIIFTASWCQPCHKLIPVLKELYAELKDKLVFTYISIDDSKTVKNWPKVIQENQITWRCLTASDKLDEVMKTYTIQGIPLAYHVSKSGSFKEVHLQNAKERAALIQTVLAK